MKVAITILALAGTSLGQVALWGQCGGIGYSGSTTCSSGVCSALNPYYSQCLPGSSGPTTTSSSSSSSSRTTSTRTSTSSSRTSSTLTRTTTTSSSRTTTASRTTTQTPNATGGGPGPGSTLIPPNIWIRAVVPPYYHKYLQSQTLRTSGNAVLGDHTTAAQFDVINGQLRQLIDTSGTVLYAQVEPKTSDSQNKLLLTFASSPNTYGTFSWSGDSLLWTNPSVPRQNNAAWLICEDAKVYINLGAYGYMTPAGCSDATIHYYNGAVAND